MREKLTDEEVEIEIERLRFSEDVKLARVEQRLKYRKRQYLYTLRCLEKKGKELRNQGITIDNLMDEERTIDSELDGEQK